jgi:uncharacterized membrane protein/predicted DsbA family dithiol-disulfide isomerase
MRSERTAGTVGLAASLVPVLAGIVASAMLAVDYLRPAPVFCVEGGGCEALRHTAYAMPLGVPMPLVGLAGFLAIGVVSLLAGARARFAQLALGVGAGLTGLLLVTVQARLGHLCPYCLVADASGIVSALVAGARMWLAAEAPSPRGLAYGGAGALLLALLLPLVVGFRAPTPVPAVIRDEMARTPPGQITIVDFVDFECPFCRMTQAELEPLVDAHRDRIHLVRRQVPLHSHPHALDAARAACCGERLGQGDAMASALFAAPVEDLTRQGCEKIAQGLGLSLDPYRACVADPATDMLIEADRAEFKAAGGFALPTIWVGDRQLVGAQPPEALAQAIDDALSRAGS